MSSIISFSSTEVEQRKNNTNAPLFYGIYRQVSQTGLAGSTCCCLTCLQNELQLPIVTTDVTLSDMVGA